MRDRPRLWRWGRRLSLILLVPALALLIAACGGDDDGDSGDEGGGDSSEPIRIGFLSTCEGAFGAFYEATAGGFNVPLIERGAEPVSDTPSDGVEGAEIAGRPVEVVGYGCSDETPEVAVNEARRLVEQEGADILIGPLSGDEGIAIANYAKEQPDKTFVNGAAGAQDATLKVQAPNFFRFHTDGAQWSAGVGEYAVKELGWKRAAVIGDDYSFAQTSAGGFIADFCANGGQVVKRIWPSLGETDYSSFIAQIPDNIDGIYTAVGGEGLISFINQYIEQKGPIEPDEMIGNLFVDDPIVLKEIGEEVIGVTVSGNTAADATGPDVEEYLDRLSVYPEVAEAGASVFVYHYYGAMEAVAKAIEQLDGDISDVEAFHEALANMELTGPEAPYGDVRLDENRQAISDNYVKQVVPGEGNNPPTVKTIARVPQVDQQFGGAFTPDTPSPDRKNPECKDYDLPWEGKLEPVDFESGESGE
ncbi:MAG TPA: ABC transporter substrate-binding protein [Solirubrobacterales bacterium]